MEQLEMEGEEDIEVVRVYVRRSDEDGTWEVQFENGLEIPYELKRLSDVDKAINIAKRVHEEMTGRKLNIIRFIDMEPECFGDTVF